MLSAGQDLAELETMARNSARATVAVLLLPFKAHPPSPKVALADQPTCARSRNVTAWLRTSVAGGRLSPHRAGWNAGCTSAITCAVAHGAELGVTEELLSGKREQRSCSASTASGDRPA